MEKAKQGILYQSAFKELWRGFVAIAAILLAASWLSMNMIGDMDDRQASFAQVELVTLDGQGRTDASLFAQNPITVVNIWATFCSPCIREMPGFEEVSKDYADRGVQIIGICANIAYDKDGEPDAKLIQDAYKVIETTGATYPQYRPTQDCYARVRALAESGFPYTFILDSEGKVRKVFVGGIPKERLIEALDWQLAQ